MDKELCKECGLYYSQKGGFVCACDDSWSLGGGDKKQISFHINKLHVSTKHITIARDILKRGKHIKSKKARFAGARWALQCHEENQGLYRAVMSGQLTVDKIHNEERRV